MSAESGAESLVSPRRASATTTTNDNDDDDNDDTPSSPRDPSTAGLPVTSVITALPEKKWKAANYATRAILEHVKPMLQNYVTETARQAWYNDRSYLPYFVTTRLVDPFLALRYNVNESLLYEKGVDDIADAISKQAAESAGAPDKKHKSLRRAFTKSKLSASGEATTAEALKKSIGNLEEEKRVAKIITAEVERVIMRLSRVSETFAARMVELTETRDKTARYNMYTLSPYVLIHPSISQHPKLVNCRLGDYSMVLELGRCCMRQFIVFETFAQAYTMENAEARCRRVESFADEWLKENFPAATISDMMPVEWFLHPVTHEPLDEAILTERRAAMIREIPFIIIGFLHILQFYSRERDRIMWSIYQKMI
jgi:hypothetical protein